MKKKKKIFGQTFVAVLAAGTLTATPAWADSNETGSRSAAVQSASDKQLEQALENVYKAVPELKRLTVKHKSYNPGENGHPATWSIHFDNRPEDAKREEDPKYASAFVNLNAETGELLDLQLHHPDWASDEVPAEKMAREKADEFVKRIFGDKIKDFRASDTLGYGKSGVAYENGKQMEWAHADVRYERLINGIPLINSGFNVSVDAAGHVNRFYQDRSFSNPELEASKFPSPSEIISKEEAEQAYMKKLDMKLVYTRHQPVGGKPFSDNSETRPVLQYVPFLEGVLDAKTGQFVDFGQKPDRFEPKKVFLSPQGNKLLAKSREEAEKLLSDTLGIDTRNMKFNQNEEIDWPSNKRFTHYSWSTEPKNANGKPDYSQMRYIHMAFDPATGDVLSMNVQDESARGKRATVSQTDAEKAAVQFLEQYLDPQFTELSLEYVFFEPRESENIPSWVDTEKLNNHLKERVLPVYRFTFNTLHQGVPVTDQAFHVEVDGLTGKVAGFSLQPAVRDDIRLPDNKNVIPAEEAKREFLRQHPLQLVYLWPEFFDQKAPAPMLVYIPTARGFSGIDALTGQAVK